MQVVWPGQLASQVRTLPEVDFEPFAHRAPAEAKLLRVVSHLHFEPSLAE